ncbi:ParA family protein [Kutzneria buriramensis]|uniref:Chromosome partitioning protein n=1 Tax=Kutzneria buriramensis TaxID=1045776 RepID=A0A3E0G5Z2_9PSEU|nr:ParA family protein [Kutzneria buriramensis]REH18025.1 chromosome partitioning protein [Kutzneria buriramensis]
MASLQILRLLIATLKGGPGKTTSVILLAIALARRNYNVVVICADTRTRGATDWVQESLRLGYTVPFKLAIWEEKNGPLSAFARTVEQQTGADAVLIDTGGEQPEAFAHGCLYADKLIMPVGPMNGELRRILETYRHAAAINESGSKLDISVLLTRVPQAGKGKAREAREDLSTDLRAADGTPDPDKPYALGLHVLTAEITRAGAYDEMYCIIPDDVGEYEDLCTELVGPGNKPGTEGAA